MADLAALVTGAVVGEAQDASSQRRCLGGVDRLRAR